MKEQYKYFSKQENIDIVIFKIDDQPKFTVSVVKTYVPDFNNCSGYKTTLVIMQ